MLLTLTEALADRERQDSEFKTSTAETAAAAQALVGFANSRGGQVFFGITDDRVVKGIDFGSKTIEDLADKLDKYIYPALPLEFDDFSVQNGKRVVRVWTPADKPPIIGGYVYSKRQLNIDDRLELAKAQAYRRVGRQTRKVDFMWLRGTLPSDPLVVIDVTAGARVRGDQLALSWIVWHISGGVALDLNVTTEPPLGPPLEPLKDLPGSKQAHASGALPLNFSDLHSAVAWEPSAGGKRGAFWLVVRYRDDWSCEWEARRRVQIEFEPEASGSFNIGPDKRLIVPIRTARAWSTPEFRRGLTSLPPKRLASPK